MPTVQGVIGFSTLIILKQLYSRWRLKGSGSGPMSSSFPRHGAKIRIKTQSERTKNHKPKPRADCKLAQKQNIETKSI